MDFETWYNATGKSIIKDDYAVLPVNELLYTLMEKAYNHGYRIGKNKGSCETFDKYAPKEDVDDHPLYGA